MYSPSSTCHANGGRRYGRWCTRRREGAPLHLRPSPPPTPPPRARSSYLRKSALLLEIDGVDCGPYFVGALVGVYFYADTSRLVVVYNRGGLAVVLRQTFLQRLCGVVFALHKRLASFVVAHVGRARGLAGLERFRWRELDVVRAPAGLVDPSAANAFFQDRVWDGQLAHGGYPFVVFGEHFVQRFCLWQRAREAVENEAPPTVHLLDAVADDAYDNVVADKAAGLHNRLGLLTNFSLCGHRGAQHISGGQMWDLEFCDNLWGLGSLARARWAKKDDDLPPLLLLFFASGGQEIPEAGGHGGDAGDSCNVVGHGKGGWLLRLLVSMNNYSKRMEQINGVEFVSWGEVTNCKV